MKPLEVLTSRQFWAAIVGLLIVFFGERSGLTADQITDAIYLLMTYIVGRGVQVGLAGKDTYAKG
jgi:hypothetical protein